MRSQEVVVGDEECGQDSSAVYVFESAPSAGVELIGTIQAFDELLERAILLTFIVIIGEFDDRVRRLIDLSLFLAL